MVKRNNSVARAFHPREKSQPAARGFVLIDALTALAILGSGILVVAVFFRTEVRQVRGGHERLSATLLAQSELERLDTLPWAEIARADGPVPMTLPAARRLKEARATLARADIEPGLAQVTARVEWQSGDGKPLFVEISRVFSQEAHP